MKYVVIVDSMSNIPEHVLKSQGNIKVVPLNIQIDDKEQLDLLSADQLSQFYKNNPLKEGAKADATSPTAEQMTVFIVNEIAPYYDGAVFQSTSSILSDVFKNIAKCAETIEEDTRAIRTVSGLTEPFKLIVSNSGNSSSGQTILALYSDALVTGGVSPEALNENANKFKKTVKTYSIIRDIMQARARMSLSGQKTVSMTSAVSGQLLKSTPIVTLCNDEYEVIRFKISFNQARKSLFEFAEQCIESGLHLPIIYVSYAGLIGDLHEMKEFRSLYNKAKQHRVTVISGMMSVSACINYSSGSISLGIAPKDQSANPA